LYEEELFELAEGESLAEKIKVLKLPDKPKSDGFRELTEKDIPEVQKLFAEQNIFNIYPIFTEAEFKRIFLDYPEVIKSYVVENESTAGEQGEKKITEFII